MHCLPSDLPSANGLPPNTIRIRYPEVPGPGLGKKKKKREKKDRPGPGWAWDSDLDLGSESDSDLVGLLLYMNKLPSYCTEAPSPSLSGFGTLGSTSDGGDSENWKEEGGEGREGKGREDSDAGLA
jgi:hypothetical protein